MTVVSITLPSELIEKFDAFIKDRGYFSRSEGFRDAVRTLMAEGDLGELHSEKVATIILTACDIRRKDVDVRLVELRNDFEDMVVENLHRYIENEYCIDVFLAQGEHKRILDFLGRVRGTRGVQQVKTIFLPLKGQSS
ncbi:MAG: CopG family ribbon-helix-helix protein [Nitrososphaerota archaeon]|nr:CopG family ribbon-helix-helix protein [Nitrososphaerota archaeon]MDG7023770.1 CopG family ribbon-helix-helix protein [Nitrososphaerota archaeon]